MSKAIVMGLMAAAMMSPDAGWLTAGAPIEVRRDRNQPVVPPEPARPQPYRPIRRRYERDREPRTHADAAAKARAEAKRERKMAKRAKA